MESVNSEGMAGCDILLRQVIRSLQQIIMEKRVIKTSILCIMMLPLSDRKRQINSSGNERFQYSQNYINYKLLGELFKI